MANTKITSHVIANDAVTVDMITDAAVTADKLHATLDLSGKTLTLPSAQAATTQSASDNTTKVATTAYVTTAISNLVDSAPAALDTLNEIAAALGDDANYASTTTASIAAKLPLAGGTLTGNLVLSGAPTSGLHPATKTYTDTADALKLNLSGGTLTGDLILNTTTALKIPVGTTAQRPSAATGQLRWNTSDGALEAYNGSAWTAVGTSSSNKILDTFTGDGSTTAYTLSVTPANEDALIVFIDGVYQEKGDYALSNAVLTLDTAPASGEKLAVHITTASVHDGTSGLNQQFTGDGSTVAFTLSQDPKSENNTQIYINGVYQQKTDYTVSGTTLTFDTAPETGDIIEVNMFTVTTLGNTDTVSEGTSNLYHTTARARSAISVSGSALSYNSSTGVITSAYEETPTFTGTVTAPLVDAAILDGENFKINGGQGSDGQVITSTGSGVAWEDIPSAATISNTAPSSPSEGDMWFNSSTSTVSSVQKKSMAVYSGTAWVQMSTKFAATGGTITTSGIYTIHTFTSSGTFTVEGSGEVEYLVIAGGGSGGGQHGGGGGAGGYRTGTGLGVTEQAYTVTVGAGGAAIAGGASPNNGNNGSNSVFSTITSIGGGGGQGWNMSGQSTGKSGGSGGGASLNASGGAGTAGQGNAGGSSTSSSTFPNGGGGGGGSGSVGEDSINLSKAGNGGSGTASSITGSSVTRAGGGGGGSHSPHAIGLAGSGGAGAGGLGNVSGGAGIGGTATANTGSGGGGSGASGSASGAGGSGIVILRYVS